MKKALAMLLVVLMALTVFAACHKDDPNQPTNPTQAPSGDNTPAPAEETPVPEPQSYTYNTYSTSLGNNWNPHTWETNADDTILSYLSSPFCTMQAENTEDGIYQWVYEMATSITDVTAEHKDDLEKYPVSLGDKSIDDITEGYVFEIKLNPDAKWEDGTPINADSYIYSMKMLLDPEMKNYRANLYYTGESAVAGGNAYFFQGSDAWTENAANAAYTFDDLTLNEEGQYVTPEGYKVYWAVNYVLNEWLGGNTLKDYVEAYGDAYFGMDTWEALVAMVDDNGLVPATEETYALFAPITTTNANWGETEADLYAYLVYGIPMPECDYDSTVGCYKVDDYTIRYVNESAIDYYYFLTSCTSTWLVYGPYYEAGFDTTGKLKTTNYGTDIGNTMSYGPYKLESLQKDKQIVFTQNENWYGWQTAPDGSLVSYTDYLVNGVSVQRYQTTRIVIDVMDDDAAKQAFLKGELTEWAPTSEDLPTYGASDQLYKADESYTMSFFFNTDVDMLKEMDNSKGNTNSVVLSNVNFRRAFSYAIDRSEWVTATAGFKPAFGLMNDSYYYNFYNDPTSSYRSSDAAMQAICDLYGVQFGEGTPYATLKEAYKSINGYNLTLAQQLMKQAYDELTAAGLYSGGEIKIRIAYMKGAMSSAENKQVELFNKYINAAVEGSGFGHVTLEALGNVEDRYAAVPAGEFAIGYGAWGGAQLYPFRNFRVYCDPTYVDIHEAACWDPSKETLTLTVNGEEVTMTWQEWSASMLGTGRFAGESNETKLDITAQMEKLYLEKVYRIPLATSTTCTLLAYKAKFITPDYNLAYGWGGLELMTYNYSDKEWTDFVASQGGILNYE
jgi:oligopeptide transport system substrate-binding protein